MVPSQVFEIAVRRHQSAIRRFLTQLTNGDTMLAEDLAQDTFIKAFYAWDTFAALSSAKTWLMRIAYTTFIDYTRRHHVCEDIEGVEEPEVNHGPRADIQIDVQQAMCLLSPPERACVQLALMEDLSMRKVAQITGMNENTVKSHLRRGKEKLKHYLTQHGYDR